MGDLTRLEMMFFVQLLLCTDKECLPVEALPMRKILYDIINENHCYPSITECYIDAIYTVNSLCWLEKSKMVLGGNSEFVITEIYNIIMANNI